MVWGETAAHRGAMDGHLDALKLAVERGVDLTIADRQYHSTPLGWAQDGERQAVIDYLKTLPERLGGRLASAGCHPRPTRRGRRPARSRGRPDPMNPDARAPAEIGGVLAEQTVPGVMTLNWPVVPAANEYSVSRGRISQLGVGQHGACVRAGGDGEERANLDPAACFP